MRAPPDEGSRPGAPPNPMPSPPSQQGHRSRRGRAEMRAGIAPNQQQRAAHDDRGVAARHPPDHRRRPPHAVIQRTPRRHKCHLARAPVIHGRYERLSAVLASRVYLAGMRNGSSACNPALPKNQLAADRIRRPGCESRHVPHPVCRTGARDSTLARPMPPKGTLSDLPVALTFTLPTVATPPTPFPAP